MAYKPSSVGRLISAQRSVVTVGSFTAGVRNNIVPETATLSGTIRTFDAGVRSSIHEKIRSIAEQTATAMGAVATVEIDLECRLRLTIRC